MNQVFYGPAVIISLFSTIIASPPSALATSSWLLQEIYITFRYVSNGSSSVTYCSMCLKLYPCYKLLKKSCLGVYSGIFVIYIQCPSNNSESRTRSANIIFYILCLLYILCAATVVCDLLEGVFAVSNKFNCHGKNIIFIISCAVPFFLCTIASTWNRLTVNK